MYSSKNILFSILLKSSTVLVLSIFLLQTMACRHTHGPGPVTTPSSNVYFTHLGFEPIESNNYNLTCTHEHMNYADVKLFRPIVKLSAPALHDFQTYFTIHEHGWPDIPTIGYFLASFRQGDTEPSSITTPNDIDVVEEFLKMNINRMPVGAPSEETGAFWLGCTKKCIVRGNGPKGRAGAQDVFLKPPYLVPSWFSTRPSNEPLENDAHEVKCL